VTRAIFVVTGSSTAQQGPVAALVSTAGWAAAAQRVLGEAWIATPQGLLDPATARQRGSAPTLRSSSEPRLRRHLPAPVKTAVKDVRQWRRARGFRVDPTGPWSGHDVAFVWQRHELFQDAGIRLAGAIGAPSVLFVPATVVWEADQWGTTRPGYGAWLERHGEAPSLRAADLVACGAEPVAEQVERLGVDADRILLTPSGVDLDLFDAHADRAAVRARLGLDGRFVVGWVGSFRRFHAIEQAVEAVAAIDGATLLLVGDGPERPRIEQLARDRGVEAVFTGTVEHRDLPAHLAAMDVGLVLAPVGAEYHYSPLKLAEYLATGITVVAPAVGQLRERLTDGVDAVLVAPHDHAALVDALTRLRDDPAGRDRIGRAARAAAEADWSWDHQVRRVLAALRPGETGQSI
jgi:glycosyltransferase involved in cell wall biosynthesis